MTLPGQSHPVQVSEGSAYGGRAVRSAIAQMDADLGSATMAVEEARYGNRLKPADARDLEAARKAVVKAARAVARIQRRNGWEDPA